MGQSSDYLIEKTCRSKIFTERGIFYWVSALMAIIAIGSVAIIFIYLINESFPIIKESRWAFIFGNEWYAGEVYGALPMVYGSLMVTLIALIIVLPFAIGGAIFTSEFLPCRPRLLVKSMMELLAGVPGVIYGLIGIALLAPLIQRIFGLIDGSSVFTAGVLLAIMILPTIMSLSEDALRAVPGEYRDAGLGLGLTKIEMIFRIVFPNALPGIAGAVLLGLGRAMGETIAVMLVIGGIDRIPQPWFDIFSPGQNIPSKLGREAAEALGSGIHWSALMGLGLVLFIIVTSTTLIGNLFLRRAQ